MKLNKKIIVAAFLLTPVIASVISSIHIVHFFMLGNNDWMSYLLAITFEIGSVASFIALSILDKIKKGIVLFIFVILFLMQLIGNVYFSFEYINIKLAVDPVWMNTFIELMKPIYEAEEASTYKFILSLIIGIPIPLVSLSFLKSLVDYLDTQKSDLPAVSIVEAPTEQPIKIEEPVVQEEVKETEQQEPPDSMVPFM